MKLASRIGRDAGLYSVEPILAKAIGIFLVPLYTAYLTTADYGTVNFLMAIGSFCLPFITMGMDAIFWMYYKGGSDEKGKVIYTTTAISSVTSLIIVGLSFVYLALNREPQSFLIVGYVCSLCLQVLYRRGLNLLRAKRKIGLFLASSGVSTLIRVSTAVFLIAYLNYRTTGVVYSMMTAYTIGGIAAYLYIRRSWCRETDPGVHREYLKNGWPLMLGNVAALMMNLADKFTLNYLSTKSELGLYSFAFNFAVPFSTFAFAPFMKAWAPLRWELFRGNDPHTAFRKVAGALTTLLPASALAYSGLAIAAAKVLSQDQSYNVSLYLVPVLAMSKVLYGLYWFDLMGFLFSKRTNYLPFLTTTMGVANIVGNVLLVERYGAYGAALATLGSFLLIRYVALYLSQKVYSYRRKFSAETVVVILSLALAFLMKELASERIVVHVLAGFVFAAAVLMTGVLTGVTKWQYFKVLLLRIRRKK